MTIPYNSKWREFKDALRLMRVGDPILQWDVHSLVTAKNYAREIAALQAYNPTHRFKIRSLGEVALNGLMRVSIKIEKRR